MAENLVRPDRVHHWLRTGQVTIYTPCFIAFRIAASGNNCQAVYMRFGRLSSDNFVHMLGRNVHLHL